MQGKTFYTLKAAKHFQKTHPDSQVRRLSKKQFPLRKKRYHVGSYYDWLTVG